MGIRIARQINLKNHIAALERRREVIGKFCWNGVFNLLSLAMAPILSAIISSGGVPDVLRNSAAKQAQNALQTFCGSLFEMLTFDVTQAINILTEQLANQPKRKIEMLARLTARRDSIQDRAAVFFKNMNNLAKNNQEIVDAIRPLFENMVSAQLASMNDKISALQAEMERSEL